MTSLTDTGFDWPMIVNVLPYQLVARVLILISAKKFITNTTLERYFRQPCNTCNMNPVLQPLAHLTTSSWFWIRLLRLSSDVTSTVVAVVFW